MDMRSCGNIHTILLSYTVNTVANILQDSSSRKITIKSLECCIILLQVCGACIRNMQVSLYKAISNVKCIKNITVDKITKPDGRSPLCWSHSFQQGCNYIIWNILGVRERKVQRNSFCREILYFKYFVQQATSIFPWM